MILAIPLLLPLLIIILLLFARGGAMTQKTVACVGAVPLLVNATALLVTVNSEGILVMQAGGWAAPYGITMAADMFSAIMLVATSVICLCIVFYSCSSIDEKRHAHNYFIFLYGVIMGVNGVLLTGDLFNLYVWLEVMLLASFGMMVLGGERYQLEGTIKYLALNLIGSLIFLAGTGVVYGHTGTLNFAELAVVFAAAPGPSTMHVSAMLLFIAIGIKAAIFPFFFWLPGSYHTPPVAVTAFFAGLLTKVGVYVMIRIFTLLFMEDRLFWQHIFWFTAASTMLIGVLAAASQTDMRRILSFHIISQIGYMIMGLAIFTPLAIGGALFFIIHNILVKTNLFLIAGLVHRQYGSFDLEEAGGVFHKSPWLSLLFALSAWALAGIPPLSGFAGKLLLLKAALDSHHYLIGALSLVVSLITLFSMMKIWNYVFWKPAGEKRTPDMPDRAEGLFLYLPAASLAAAAVLQGLAAGMVLDLCMEASHQLLDSSQYINSILQYQGQGTGGTETIAAMRQGS